MKTTRVQTTAPVAKVETDLEAQVADKENLAPAHPGSNTPLLPAERAEALRTTLGFTRAEPKRTAQQVGESVARELLEAASERSALSGSGVEVYGKGDPELLRRRALVAQLTDQTLVSLGSQAWIAADQQFLGKMERTDRVDTGVSVALLASQRESAAKACASAPGAECEHAAKVLADPLSAPGDQLKAVMRAREAAPPPAVDAALEAFASSFLWQEVQDALDKVRAQNAQAASNGAKALIDGTAKFFAADSQTLSTRVALEIPDASLRARTLVDLLLQFRSPIDQSGPKKRMFAGGAAMESVGELRSLTLGSFDPREYALRRAVALANPFSSSNAVLEARHTVSAIRRMSWELVYGGNSAPPGFTTAPYAAIHHNFSAESPAIIDAWISKVIFSGSSESFCSLCDAMGEANKGNTSAAMAELSALAKRDPSLQLERYLALKSNAARPLGEVIESYLRARCQGKLDSKSADDPTLTDAERENLQGAGVRSIPGEYAEKLQLCARLYRAVCKSLPDRSVLADNLFSAKAAWPSVARVIGLMDDKAASIDVLEALVDARGSLRQAFDALPQGFARLNLWKLDQKLDQLTSSMLGEAVTSAQSLSTDAQKSEALRAITVALRSAKLSGLDAIAANENPVGVQGRTIDEALTDIEALTTAGSVSLDAYRAVVATAYEAIVSTTENVRQYIDSRVPDVSNGPLIPNPAFMDDFIKEGPLHYARALAQKALTVGLSQQVSDTRIVNPDGVVVLNNIGRTVFDRLIIAENSEQLAELGAGAGDFCIVREMDDKKLRRSGAIMSNFPGGYCHAAVYARGAGMAALSSANIGAAWDKFADKLGQDKLYYDDSNGQLTMMPLAEAKKCGLVKAGEEALLKPSSNREVEYLGWDERKAAWETIGKHSVFVSPQRPTHHVQIFTPAQTVRGLGEQCLSFEDAGALGIDARALGGEKNTVLSMMAVDPALKDMIPPGSFLTTTRCFSVLESAGILDDWRAVYENDPYVQRIDDKNFLESKLYTDAAYRKSVRTRLFDLVTTRVTQALVSSDGTATAAGQALLAELRSNPRLKDCDDWIIRSSYSAEDRPFKSGAGQYDSFPHCRTDAEILTAVAKGLASAWDEPPVENNVLEEYNLMHIQPSLTAMKCLTPEFSGVLVSRDTDTGYRRTVSYQTVMGFGGGVEDGVTEEGRINSQDHTLKRTLEGKQGSILSPQVARQLWEAGLRIERLFHEKVEAGRGFAVDVEWAFDDAEQKLYIVQARTVRA